MTQRLLAIAALAAASCLPAQVPTAIDAATEAVRLTDKALAEVIKSAPAPYDAPAWEARVSALEDAAAVVRAGRDACPALAKVAPVAQAIDCTPCAAAIAAARKELACP